MFSLLHKLNARLRVTPKLYVRCYGQVVTTTPTPTPVPPPHTPVLVNEIIHAFAPVQLTTFVDCTIGAAGHSRLLIQSHPEMKLLIGIDQDEHSLEIARQELAPYSSPDLKICLIHDNFKNLSKILQQQDVQDGKVDGVLIDLGISSMQVDDPERGFSIRQDGPMDMRMNKKQKFSAKELVNEWPESDLGELIRDFGEERMWRRVAGQIVEYREEHGPIETTQQLVKAIGDTYSLKFKQQFKKISRRGDMQGPIHPATRTFQALRIAVNQEITAIKSGLPQAIQCLRSTGRCAVISFHSLEDRMVKRTFREAAGEPQTEDGDYQRNQLIRRGIELDEEDKVVKFVKRKAIVPTQEEIESNPRSRSAKLRLVEKL